MANRRSPIAEFDTFIPMGTKEAKTIKDKAVDVMFKTYSRGVAIKANRDAWTYNSNRGVSHGKRSARRWGFTMHRC